MGIKYYFIGGEKTLVKCPLCGAEVKNLPSVTKEGKCSICGANLTVKK